LPGVDPAKKERKNGHQTNGHFHSVGVAHGFVALTDATLTYMVDNYCDGADEHGVAWNDPDLALPWGVETPTVSPRDAANRFLKEIPAGELPKRRKGAQDDS
jgi:dTDP-4-dehydrorhamnose 3,5-epimerase